MQATARNSLCQFWNDSNQKRLVYAYCHVVTALCPCVTCSSL